MQPGVVISFAAVCFCLALFAFSTQVYRTGNAKCPDGFPGA